MVRTGDRADHVGDLRTPVPAPLRLYRTTVRPEWVDYNDHMSEWCFLLVMGDSSDAFFRYVGIDETYRAAGASLFTVETHIRNVAEVSGGDKLELSLQVLGTDNKRIHLAHHVMDGKGRLAATGEQLLLHVDSRLGRVTSMPAALLARVEQVAESHAVLPHPAWVGHVMGIPRRDASPTGDPEVEGAGSWTST